MNRTSEICFKCYKSKKFCKCVHNHFELIDSNLSYAIRNLNKKGYKTKFCCGGHPQKAFIYIYIYFDNEYNFNILPEDYKYKNKILYYKKKKQRTIKETQQLISSHIKILNEWVKTL